MVSILGNKLLILRWAIVRPLRLISSLSVMIDEQFGSFGAYPSPCVVSIYVTAAI